MKLYQQIWWKKLFERERHVHVDTLKDIEAIKDCLLHLEDDTKLLLKKLNELEELEKERKVGTKSVIQINLESC